MVTIRLQILHVIVFSVTGGKYKSDFDNLEEDRSTVLGGDPEQDELPHVFADQPKYDVSKSFLNKFNDFSNFHQVVNFCKLTSLAMVTGMLLVYKFSRGCSQVKAFTLQATLLKEKNWLGIDGTDQDCVLMG